MFCSEFSAFLKPFSMNCDEESFFFFFSVVFFVLYICKYNSLSLASLKNSIQTVGQPKTQYSNCRTQQETTAAFSWSSVP